MSRLIAAIALVASCLLSASSANAQSKEINFSDFPARVLEINRVAAPRLQRGTDFWNFRTAIREGVQEGPNFAGHYIVVRWGCGTECQMGAIVDALSGKIYEAPQSEWDVEFQPNSRLFIVNPDLGEEPPEWISKQWYEWDEANHRFNLIQEQTSAGDLRM